MTFKVLLFTVSKSLPIPTIKYIYLIVSDCSCIVPGYVGSVVPASYGRCLAYYKPSAPGAWYAYSAFCTNTSLTGGFGVGNVGKLIDGDYANIKAAWKGQPGVDQDFYIGLVPWVCNWGGGCPAWFNNNLCPNYVMNPWDLPDGYDQTNPICDPSMLPANFTTATWYNYAANLNAVMCEFGKK